MSVPGLAAVAGSRAQPRHHQNHNPGGQLFKNNGPRLPAGASQKGAPKGSRKYTKSGLQGKRPGGTPRIWPTARLTRTKPCMALNLATVLHFQDTDRGPQNPGCHGPELIAMLKGAARDARRDPPWRHFCGAVGVPRIVPYISPQIDEHTFFLHAAGRSFSAPWAALACRGLAEAAADRSGSTTWPHIRRPAIPWPTYKSEAAIRRRRIMTITITPI